MDNNTKNIKERTRQYKEGSIYQRKSDSRWVTKYRPNNAIKPIVRTSKTEKEAKEKLKNLKRLEVLGVQTTNQSISTLVETWLKTFRMPVLKTQTYDTEERAYLCHIKTTIGHYQAHHITSMILQNLINQKSTMLGHKTLGRLYRILKQFFTYIYDEGILEKNPMNSVVMPKESNTVQKDNPIYYLEIEEIQRIEKVVKEQVQLAWKSNQWGKNIIAKYGYIVLFLINTGLRKGEMLALSWQDLQFNEQRVNIYQSLALVKNRNRKKGEPKNIWQFGPLKSKNSIRLASFNEKAREYMKQQFLINEHLKYMDKKYIARTQTGKPLSKSQWTNLLTKICELAKVNKPISPHELRHTYATLCISKGVNELVVCQRMGHASLQQTYEYVHLLKDVEEYSDGLIENLIP